jgi:hypothetical protein
MNKPYSRGNYHADFAIKYGGSRTAITAKGVGNWWKASFKGGDQLIERVRVKNRHDCCADRLAFTKITIDGEVCGTIPNKGLSNGAWVEVKCAKPLVGGEI